MAKVKILLWSLRKWQKVTRLRLHQGDQNRVSYFLFTFLILLRISCFYFLVYLYIGLLCTFRGKSTLMHKSLRARPVRWLRARRWGWDSQPIPFILFVFLFSYINKYFSFFFTNVHLCSSLVILHGIWFTPILHWSLLGHIFYLIVWDWLLKIQTQGHCFYFH